MPSLDQSNSDAKALRYYGGGLTLLSVLGEIACGISYLAHGDIKSIKLSASIIGSIGIISALFFVYGVISALKRDTCNLRDVYGEYIVNSNNRQPVILPNS